MKIFKKVSVLCLIFFMAAGLVFAQAAQDRSEGTVQSLDEGSQIYILDNAVRRLSRDFNRKIIEINAENIGLGQFTYHGSSTNLGHYWQNQLIQELVNIPNRSFDIISPGTATDWIISGEIINAAGIIRIYSRLINTNSRVIEGAFYSDLELNMELQQMLGSGTGTISSESNSWSFPIPYQIGNDPNVQSINRTLQEDGEEYFLLVPQASGRLVMETTGSIDTFMEFYDANTEDFLDDNDDGGANRNARIVYNVQAGRRYIALVRGFSSSTSGSYGFRAYMQNTDNRWENPIRYDIGQDERHPVIDRNLGGGDEDFFLLVPDSDGRMTMETTGETDTFMEFYEAESRRLLSSNDDGGSGLNARITHTVEAGSSYIAKVRGYSSSSSGSYGFRAYLIPQADLSPDEYEPNDDPDSATLIQIGQTQTHSFHTPDDVDWFIFQVEEPGRITIHTRGTVSDRMDTYIELFDSNLNFIDEDDDGGDYRDSLLSLQLNRGTYFLKVWCLDSEPNQPYTISITMEN